MPPEERIKKALEIARTYGDCDGAHHKMWVIDQMMRALLADKYDEYIRTRCTFEDGPELYTWDTGTPP